MTDPKEPVRYHVVRHTVTLVHEYPQKYDESAEFALTENGCFQNVISNLAAALEVDDEFSVCSVCAAHSAEYIGAFDTPGKAEAAGWTLKPKVTAYDLNPERRREHNESLFKKDDGDPEAG